MPSQTHAADLERVLARAAQECTNEPAWFGQGLPERLRDALAAAGRLHQGEAQTAFIEVQSVSPQGASNVPPGTITSCRVVGLSNANLDGLGSLISAADQSGLRIERLICPVAVFDFTPDGVRVREVSHGLTAADLQQALAITLWAGPDLKELGSH